MSGPEAHRDQPAAADTAISDVPGRAAAGTAPPPASGDRPRVEHPTGPTDVEARLTTGPDGRTVARRHRRGPHGPRFVRRHRRPRPPGQPLAHVILRGI
ncbi:hypothetical protein NKH77_55500 [Streptomyces sp. M19]